MFKQMVLVGLLIMVFAGSLFANGIDCQEEETEFKERPTYWKDAKISILTSLDSLIQNNIPIDFEKMELESQDNIMRGDVRQIEFYFRFMTDGVKFTQKIGIDGIAKWWYNPEGGLDPRSIEWLKMAEQYVVIDADSSYINKYKPIIIKKLYVFLDDEYPALQVSAARTLINIGVSDNLIIDKLEYYANGINSDQWDIEYTGYPDRSSIYWEGKTEKERKNDCVRAIMNIGKSGLMILENRFEDKRNSIKQSRYNEKKINELNFNIRDLDWDGQTSADYCKQYWGPDITDWNQLYTYYPGNDCCNFASQCLIAGCYDDIIPASASYPPANVSPESCITWCPSLHDYLSNRFDIDTTVVDFHINGWENLSEPNNHIPANFSIGDIAVVGYHEDLTGTYSETSWTAPFPKGDDKKFYYVTSSDEREQRLTYKIPQVKRK